MECGLRGNGSLVVGRHIIVKGALYVQCKVYLASIENLESHVKGAMFENSVKFKPCFSSETKLYFHVKEALFTSSAEKSFMLKGHNFFS